MLNLNYNFIGVGDYDRYSKEESKGFIPFQIQYLIVAGGGGSAGGDNNLEAGQAGAGGQVVTGSYCVQPFQTYEIKVGDGGIGGQRTSTFPAYTGSNGETSSFAEVFALGGNGGYIQDELTASFYAGTGSGGDPIEGNGGIGSQWTYNQSTSSVPPYPPFNHAGELISQSYYSGGGAGFMVNPPLVEYLIVGGGGRGSYGFGGEAKTGSFTAFPSESYYAYVGAGGIGSPGIGTGSFLSGSNVTTPIYDSANGGITGSSILPPPAGSGNNGSGSGHDPYTGSFAFPNTDVQFGGDGTQWLDGKWYGGGAAPANSTPTGNGRGGRGGGANGGSTNLTSYDPFGNFLYDGGSTISQIPTDNQGGGGATSGSVVFRYLGSPIATGGTIIESGSYTYHYFTTGGFLDITLSDTLIYPGLPGIGGGGVTGSNATPNTGGGAGASFYFDSGSKGGSGFVAIRYEGAPIAEGGNIVVTDHYTYHLFSSSGDFYVIGNETNPNINPCV